MPQQFLPYCYYTAWTIYSCRSWRTENVLMTALPDGTNSTERDMLVFSK
jgi:hypothetical protein